MKLLIKILSLLFCFGVVSLKAQDNTDYRLFLKSGKMIPEKKVDIENEVLISLDKSKSENIYRLVQFYKIPSTIEKATMRKKGLQLMGYVPNNTFFCSIDRSIELKELKGFNIRSIIQIKPSFKISKTLLAEDLPQWALVGEKKIKLNVRYFLEKDKLQLTEYIARNNGRVVKYQNEINTMYIEYDIERIIGLAKNELVQWIEPIPSPPVKDDTEGRSLHRSNAINTEYHAGRRYDGDGVVIAIADDGAIGPHIDYKGRLTQFAGSSRGSHGDMTVGIMFGAGNLNPRIKGMASGADMYYYDIGGNPHIVNAVTNMANLGTVVTSTSYSGGEGGRYTGVTAFIDRQIFRNPNIMHVFSAGNAGRSDHGYGAGAGWGNITGGLKAGKNVITSGNLNNIDNLETNSSRGPADDGRIKPDLCANGIGQRSTAENNGYLVGGGTSAAAPGIAGVVAQLYQAYKEANSGNNPPSGLIKASLLNTAEDLGNPGPDFKHGWGRINALKAVRIIEENRYFANSLSQGVTNSHNIVVPTNVKQVRIMTYWMDVEGNPVAARALVNDINMQVVAPNATSFNPWVLDPTPNAANLDLDAVRGIDNLNNVEQVTIDNPAAGNYTVNVSGFSIPQGPQEYFVLYDFIYDEIELTYPIGGEGFNPGTLEIIRWDTYGEIGSFDLEYSINNGVSWTIINTNISGSRRSYNWIVPSDLSGEVLVRLERGGLTDVSDNVFSIISTPVNLEVDWVCLDSMLLSWDAVAGATSYEVSVLGTKYMDSVDVTNTNSYIFNGLSSSQSNWFSVRAHGPDNARSERAIAIEKVAGIANCPITLDASTSSILPNNQAKIHSCMFDDLEVSIKLKNTGRNIISNIPVNYTLNGGAVVTEVYSGFLGPGASVNYNFQTGLTPVSGINDLLVWSNLVGDGDLSNDSTNSQFTFTVEPPKNLPWSEDFESFSLCGTANNCGVEICILSNDLINEENGVTDDIDWRVNSGPTPSRIGITPDETGPLKDFNPGTATGKYIYTEASAGCNNVKAELITPCIDLTSATNPNLSFVYHMFDQSNAMMGRLNVDVLSNGVWNNNLIDEISDDQGDIWTQVNTSLRAYVGNTIKIRFRGLTGSGWSSDISLDDLKISESTGIDDLVTDLGFSIYPNPSNGIYNYSYSELSALTIEILDVNGKSLYLNEIDEESGVKIGSIDIRAYSNGMYMLMLSAGEKRITQRIIKK